jgi:hypothetical protein
MPMQEQMSSFAKRLGGRVAQANQEAMAQPIDTGRRRLPPGIRSGLAKLSTMYTKEQTEDGGSCPKGETFFRASAIVMSPKSHAGEKTEGMVTQVIIPLCDIPERGQKGSNDYRKGKTFMEGFKAMTDLIRSLGVAPCLETGATDLTGMRTEAYWFAAMKMLIDPQRARTNPVIVEFSTRGWTPPATHKQPKPEEFVLETWHGLASAETIAKLNAGYDPAAGATDNGGLPPAPATNHAPVPTPQLPQATATPAPAPATPPAQQPLMPGDKADVVQAMIEVALTDPEGATDDGMAATHYLQEAAWANGWTHEQTLSANDWAQVGEMAMNPPLAPLNTMTPGYTAPTTTTTIPPTTPIIGSRWNFQKRTKEGSKLKNNKGEDFPAQEVTVTSADVVAKTCEVANKDGRPVMDLRTKKPVMVKFEWLEPLAY